MLRFLHAADLHLDTQPSGLHGYPDAVAEVLRDASLQAFDRLIDAAIEHQVAFCILAGDVYDGADRGLRAELALRRGLTRLADHGIASFVVHGNHDPVEQGVTSVQHWPDLVTVFAPGTPQVVTLDVDGTRVAVHGISYARRDTTDNLALRFTRAADADLQIGILHANVGGDPRHDPYAPCSLYDLRSIGLDYWALGHIHQRRVLHAGQPWVVYPGNLQGRSLSPSEQGAKGALLVTVERGRVLEPELVALDVLRFVPAAIPIDALDDLGGLTDALVAVADDARHANPGRTVVLRATLEGRGPVHAMLQRPGVHDDLLRALREAGAVDGPLVWWDRVIDDTRALLDLDQLARADDLVGNAVRRVTRVGADGALEALDELPNLEGLIDPPDPRDGALIARARQLVADLLVGEAPT